MPVDEALAMDACWGSCYGHRKAGLASTYSLLAAEAVRLVVPLGLLPCWRSPAFQNPTALCAICTLSRFIKP